MEFFDVNQTTTVHLSADNTDKGQGCKESRNAKKTFFSHFQRINGQGRCIDTDGKGCWLPPNPALLKLSIKQSYLNAAKEALDAFASSDPKHRVVTVHGRWLEGNCEARTTSGLVFCDKDHIMDDWSFACAIDQSTVEQLLPPEMAGAPIVLLEDQQHNESEATFTFRDTHAFYVQVAMMIQSTFHIGNPASSIDYVIAQLRRGKGVYPHKCYQHIE